MTQGNRIDITPTQDGGVLKEIRRQGPDPEDKPWKGDKVQVGSQALMQLGTSHRFEVITVRLIRI